MTIPKTLFWIPIFLKYGTAESMKEAITIAVKSTKTNSLKKYNKNKKIGTKKNLNIVLVEIDIRVRSLFSSIKT